MGKSSASDILRGNWVDRWLPQSAQPYARLARIDRPIGNWLLLLPCWWSLALAIENWRDIESIIHWFLLFGVGAVVMRSAGCCLNDIFDRDFDAKVSRTSSRPIPSGEISVIQAWVFFAVLITIGMGILSFFNSFSIWLGAAALILVTIYPFAKRFTNWPQLVLGLTLNWGALLGWAVVRGDIQLPAITLYVAGVFWTLGYDTIYAMQDKADDAEAGIKSTTQVLGDNTRPWLFAFYGMAIVLFGITGFLTVLSWPFYLFLGLTAAQGIWQVSIVDLKNPKDCLEKFKSNRYFGWILLAGIFLGQTI